MTSLWRRWVGSATGALLLAAAGTTGRLAAQEPAPSIAPQQVLVMLRLPPRHLRPGAGGEDRYGDAASQAARRRIALAIASRRGMSIAESWPMPRLGVDCFAFTLPAGRSQSDAVAELSRDRDVLWAQPMQIYIGRGAPAQGGDPLYPVQPAAAWRLGELHRLFTGRGTRVAVIDSQVELTHPDLAGQFSTSQDFASRRSAGAERHGTAVAGVIGAKADNGVGIAGIAPGARMMALRACWDGGANTSTLCDTLSLAKAIQYAIDNDANVINLSLSGPPTGCSTSCSTSHWRGARPWWRRMTRHFPMEVFRHRNAVSSR